MAKVRVDRSNRRCPVCKGTSVQYANNNPNARCSSCLFEGAQWRFVADMDADAQSNFCVSKENREYISAIDLIGEGHYGGSGSTDEEAQDYMTVPQVYREEAKE